MTRRPILTDILIVGLLVGTAHCRPAPEKPSDAPSTQDIAQPAPAPAGLGGTSWRLVRFQGGDGLTLRPDDKAKYTIAFKIELTTEAQRTQRASLADWLTTSRDPASQEELLGGPYPRGAPIQPQQNILNEMVEAAMS